jgi:hypothetical protein
MSEYSYDSQLDSIDGELYNIREELKMVNQSLGEIIAFLAEFKKNWGEPSLVEIPPDTDDKRSALYFMTKMTQSEFDEFRGTIALAPYKFNLINPPKNYV